MDNIKPDIILVPFITLIVIILLYIFLLKKVTDKTGFKEFARKISLLAFLLNLLWELAQLPLYKDASYSWMHISFCALGAVADMIMVALLYFSLSVVYKNPFWIKTAGWKQIITVMLAGGIGAVLAEIRHTSEANWAYANSMPILPLVNVGLSPVLQFLILPYLIYYMSWQFLNRKA